MQAARHPGRLATGLLGALLLAGCGSGVQVGELQEQVRQLRQQLDATQLQVTHMQDARAIEKLTRTYGYYIDKGLWSQVVDLFAEDGTVQLGGEGIYKGREGVARQFSMWFGKEMGRGPGTDGLGKGVLFNHPQFQGVVDVDADGVRAFGRWRTLAQVAWQGRTAFWNEGVYENEYVKENGTWKFRHMKFWPTYFTPYDVGWDKQRAEEATRSANSVNQEFPPDELPAEEDTRSLYPTYYFLPPFHYPNPVTGAQIESPGPF